LAKEVAFQFAERGMSVRAARTQDSCLRVMFERDYSFAIAIRHIVMLCIGGNVGSVGRARRHCLACHQADPMSA